MSGRVPNKRRTARALSLAREEADKARKATERRDFWICEARKEGTSLRKIAELTGLSHTAIAKIVARED